MAQHVRVSSKTILPAHEREVGRGVAVIFFGKIFSLTASFMTILPQELIELYHAVKTKDSDRVNQLTQCLTEKYGGDKVLHSPPPNPYTNYFFRIEDVVGLCVEDTQVTRKAAKELKVVDHIYFGSNGDPVENLTVQELTTLMPNIERWYGE